MKGRKKRRKKGNRVFQKAQIIFDARLTEGLLSWGVAHKS